MVEESQFTHQIAWAVQEAELEFTAAFISLPNQSASELLTWLYSALNTTVYTS